MQGQEPAAVPDRLIVVYHSSLHEEVFHAWVAIGTIEATLRDCRSATLEMNLLVSETIIGQYVRPLQEAFVERTNIVLAIEALKGTIAESGTGLGRRMREMRDIGVRVQQLVDMMKMQICQSRGEHPEMFLTCKSLS